MIISGNTQKLAQKINQLFEDHNQEPIRAIAFYLYLLGGAGCLLFSLFAALDGNWLVVGTSSSVLVAVIYSLVRFESSDIGSLFGTVSIGALGALIIGTTFNFGINDAGIQAIYPVLLMIAISFHNRPKVLIFVGVTCMIWVILLHVLGQQGFYVNRSEPFTELSKTIFVIFMIFFMTMMLLVTLQTIMAANSNLNIAKEDAIAAKIAAEDANLSKTNFLANMSHELRTPLNAIIGYSEMIEEDNKGVTAEDAVKIQTSASNLLSIINSILEISKIEKGKLQLDIQSVNIPELIVNLQTITAPGLRANQNNIQINDRSVNHPVLADPQKLKYILVNLISNANKFSNRETITFNIHQMDYSIIFEVKDKGIGIAKNDLERIFTPFEQVNNALNREFEGIGLGLAICKQYAQAMGGDISVDSELDVGSTFFLKLPAA